MKKILNGVLVILMLMSMLIVLTACGDEDDDDYSSRKKKKNKNEVVEEIDEEEEDIDYDTAEVDVIEDSDIEESSVSRTSNSNSISSISSDFNEYSEANAYVNGSGLVVFNNKGEILSDLSSYVNGYTYGYNNDYKQCVKDSKGKILYTVEEDNVNTSISIVGVTGEGYSLQTVTKDELSGKTYEARIVDLKGNTTWSMSMRSSSPEYFKVIAENYVLVRKDLANYWIVNAENGEETDLKLSALPSYLDVRLYGNNVLIGLTGNNENYWLLNYKTGELIQTTNHVRVVLNDKYIWAQPLWGTDGIYSFDGELVKELEGETRQIHYLDGKYYVMSKTGFFYTMDDDFEYIDEPVKYYSSYYDIVPVEGGKIYFSYTDSLKSNTYNIVEGTEAYIIDEKEFDCTVI